MTSNQKRILMLFGAVGMLAVAFAQDVLAVVGRPATPVSVAGAARRTVRRGGVY